MDNDKGKKYYYDYSERKVLDFVRQLSELGIPVNKDSDLYRIGFYVLEVLEKYKNPELHDNKEDFRPFMRDVMGFNNFIEKVSPLILSQHKDETIPHLRLLNTSSIPQNTKSKVTDQGANKLFELYVASLCYPQFQNIRLDSPDNSKGDNPDIIFQHNGQKWGIACKAIHSFKAKTIIDSVVKGIDQIEKSDCDTGFVLLNLKNIIDHDKIWPIMNLEKFQKGEAEPEFGTFSSFQIPGKMLEQYILTMQEMLNNEIGKKEQADLFNNKKAQPIISSILQGGTGIMKDGSPLFTFIGFIGTIRVKNVPDYVVKLIDTLNDRIR